MKASQYIRGKKSVTKSDSTYYRYARILKFIRKRPSFMYFLIKLLHALYSAADLSAQLGLSHQDSRHLFLLENLMLQLFLLVAYMNVKNAKRDICLSTPMLSSEAVGFFNDL